MKSLVCGHGRHGAFLIVSNRWGTKLSGGSQIICSYSVFQLFWSEVLFVCYSMYKSTLRLC